MLARKREPHPHLCSPPFLKAGNRIIAQVANILLFLGERHGLAPKDETGKFWAHQLQLTITDLVVEIHDTHHPVTSWLYFEEQIPAAKRRTADFWKYRVHVQNILGEGYFERVIERSGGDYVLGRRLSYVDLSLFQIVEGLRYAFPRRMKRFEKKVRHGLDRGARRLGWRSARASPLISPPSGASRSASGAFIVISRSSMGSGRRGLPRAEAQKP